MALLPKSSFRTFKTLMYFKYYFIAFLTKEGATRSYTSLTTVNTAGRVILDVQ